MCSNWGNTGESGVEQELGDNSQAWICRAGTKRKTYRDTADCGFTGVCEARDA